MKAELDLSMSEATLIISNWALTKHHRAAAQMLLSLFRSQQCDYQHLSDEHKQLQEKLAVPRDSTHLLGIDDAERLRQQGRDESAIVISSLRLSVKALEEQLLVNKARPRSRK